MWSAGQERVRKFPEAALVIVTGAVLTTKETRSVPSVASVLVFQARPGAGLAGGERCENAAVTFRAKKLEGVRSRDRPCRETQTEPASVGDAGEAANKVVGARRGVQFHDRDTGKAQGVADGQGADGSSGSEATASLDGDRDPG
jgi:hypothetical protein